MNLSQLIKKLQTHLEQVGDVIVLEMDGYPILRADVIIAASEDEDCVDWGFEDGEKYIMLITDR